MSILRNYRRVWIKANGPIPRDSNGRAYEIHHINGNHSDNRLENLQLVTIEEHYDIHKRQGDWYACIKIAKRFEPSDLREMYDRLSKNMKGNQRGKANKGKKRPDLAQRNREPSYWWTDGVRSVRSLDCPDGFTRGRAKCLS